MKYQLYSEVPKNEIKIMTGKQIKEKAQRDDYEINFIKGYKFDHSVEWYSDELIEDNLFKVFEDCYIAGSGICYSKMCIFE